MLQKLRPSDLSKPNLDINKGDYPKIVKFHNLKDQTSKSSCIVPIDKPLFQALPSVIIFENYESFTTYKRKICFRNIDKVSRRLKLVQPDSPYFDISAPHTVNGDEIRQSQVAPGMEIHFTVTFNVQEVVDYKCDLICDTEREQFIVPIRGFGIFQSISLPDEIDFGQCPIKTACRKMLLIQNNGDKTTIFKIESSKSQFKCPSEQICIDPKTSLNVEFSFIPISSQEVLSEFKVTFQEGNCCFITVVGAGVNIDVSLSAPNLSLDPSYISMSSNNNNLTLINNSNIPVSFCWKSFYTIEEELLEKDRLRKELILMENIEVGKIRNGTDQYFLNIETKELGLIAAEASILRKYRNLYNALYNDEMLFIDNIFEISPMYGQVWPFSEVEFVVSFKPDIAAQFCCFAYLDVAGRENRLPLSLNGQGIGPNAKLSFDVLDVGDVFINEKREYIVTIYNKGDISAQWSLYPSQSTFSRNFSFTPNDGLLSPGSSQDINVVFESDILGEFSEYFRFILLGNEEMLVCQIKGNIVGPTFHFDCSCLNFGTVSYDYLHKREIRLVNTSKIPMIFNLHIPQDNVNTSKEFSIIPNHGTLSANDCMDVVIEFIPLSTKIYDYSIAVDILGVGNNLLTIPIVAECVISTILLNSSELCFDDCFLRYSYEKDLRLCNESNQVYTRYEFLSQIPYTKSILNYDIIPSSGVIEPGGSFNVIARINIMKLGQFKIPIMLTIPGSQEAPIQIMLAFSSIGPRVVANVSEINLGLLNCLIDHSYNFVLTNNSLIPASLKLFTKLAKSKFQLSIREITLDANRSCDVEIVANLDDSTTIADEIHVIVDEGLSLMIPIEAKGNGTTIHCDDNLNHIDFGVQLTKTNFEKQIMLENRGGRVQVLKYTNKTENYSTSSKQKDSKYKVCFIIEPDEITLRPRTTAVFTIKGFCHQIGDINEHFLLESKIGKDKKFNVVSETLVSCCFVNPLLQFSPSNINFLYIWELGSTSQLLKENVTLSNSTSVVLNFILSTEEPFTLNSWEYSLQPGQSCDVTIEFNPFYKDNKESHIVKSRLSVSYIGHPQIDHINLMGEIVFPNLHFNNKSINFGNILNDAMKKIKLLATNLSNNDLPIKCSWSFIDDKLAMSKSVTSTPLSQIFDVEPITCLVYPGQSQEFEFSLFGLPNNKFNGIALCSVEGGPQYTLPLLGEASSVSFDINRTAIDFGNVSILQSKTEVIKITNNGNVSFSYIISQFETNDRCFFSFNLSNGNIEPNGTKEISIVISPKHPIVLEETICVQVAYFDPVYITCKCNVIFSTLYLALPRYKKYGPFGEVNALTSWDDFIDCAILNLNNQNEGNIDRKALDIEMQRLNLYNCVKQNESINQNFVIAQYVVAFGNVVVGDIKTKKFSMTNCSDITISYSFDNTKMLGLGFTIEPDKIFKLLPSDVIDFNINFTPRLNHKVGSKKVVIPVEILGLSNIEIILTGNCCIPEIDVSNLIFQFGNVLVGCCKRCFLLMQNTSLVTAYWSLKSPLMKSTTIQVFPSEGLLRPNEKVLIYIDFNPAESRSYKGEIELKVDSNKIVKIISFTGCGITTPIIFDPQVLDFGILLPFSTENSTMFVNMSNDSDDTVEVYSLDYDLKYVEEERVLSNINIFDSDGFIKSKVRQVGDGLPTQIIDAYNSVKCDVVETNESVHSFFDKVTLSIETVPRNSSTHQDILIMGPSLIGITTICENISSELSIPYRSIDNIIREVARTDSEFGKIARRVLNCSLNSDLVEFERNKYEMFEKAEKSKADVIEIFNSDKKNKGKDIPSELLETVDVIEYKQFLVEFESPSLTTLLSYRLSWEDAGYGFIFDNVVSDFINTDDVLKCFETVLKNVKIICINFDDETKYINSVKELQGRKKAEIDRINRKKIEYFSLPKKQNKKGKNIHQHQTNESDKFSQDLSRLNESWYNFETGVIDELAIEDVMDLPDSKKIFYLAVLKDKYDGQILEINDLLLKVDNIINPALGESKPKEELFVDLDKYEKLTSLKSRCKRNVPFSDYCNKLLTPLENFTFMLGVLDTSAFNNDTYNESKNTDNCVKQVLVHRGNIKSLTDDILKMVPKLVVSPPEKFAIPESHVLEIYKQKHGRRITQKCSDFKMIPPLKSDDKEFRWIMKPKAINQLQVYFLSSWLGNFESHFDFEVMTTKQVYSFKCLGKTDLPNMNSDYRHVFTKKVKKLKDNLPPPNRSYIISDKLYSFGPLLSFKKKEWRTEEEKSFANLIKTNKDMFQITNCSNLVSNIEIGFTSNGDDMRNIFLTNECILELEPLMSRNIDVWAFPKSSMSYNTSLIICLRDNPIPILYDLSCWGVETTLNMSGPWEKDVKDLENRIAACKDKVMLKELEVKLSMSKEISTLNFDRNRIGVSNQQTILLSNPSLLPVAWEASLQRNDTIIVFHPSRGIISANTKIGVTITFNSSQPLMFDEIITIKYSDVEGGLESTERVHSFRIKLLAESYILNAICLNMNGLNETNELNFGLLRIGDYAKQSLQIMNKGKYDVKFKIHFKSKLITDLINFEITEGVIPPNASTAEIQFKFCSINELSLIKNRDIELLLIEPLNDQIIEHHDILLSCTVKSSTLTIKPSNVLSFGIYKSGNNSCNKLVELRNEGPFDLTYLICPTLNDKSFVEIIDSEILSSFACRIPSALRKHQLGDGYLDKKVVPPSKNKDTKVAANIAADTTAMYNPMVYDPDNLPILPLSDKSLSINAFTILQRIGLIKVGQSAYINVSFDSTGHVGIINEEMDIYITGGRDFRIISNYCLNAEICRPGILIDNFDSIFEEQEIVTSLVTNQNKEAVCFLTVEKTLEFGQIMCGQIGCRGVVERIKITNPTKVPVNLSISVINKNTSAYVEAQATSKGGSKGNEKQNIQNQIVNDIFSVQPNSCEIPPDDVSYINIYFNPLEIKYYNATFQALVDSYGEMKSAIEGIGAELNFNLSGSGTLPSIVVHDPTELDLHNDLVIDFGRIFGNRPHKRNIILCNNGSLDANVHILISGDIFFSLVNEEMSFLMIPSSTRELNVLFSPTEIIENTNMTATIQITVLNNPYSSYKINIKGSIYICDALITKVIDGHTGSIVYGEVTDVINLPDINLSYSTNSSCILQLASNSTFYTKYEFLLSDTANYQVIPNIGHLGPRCTKDIKLVCNTTHPGQLQAKLSYKVHRISYDSDIADDIVWDNSLSIIREATSDDLQVIRKAESEMEDYKTKLEAAKKNPKIVLTKPDKCPMTIISPGDNGITIISEQIKEPSFKLAPSSTETAEDVSFNCICNADFVKFKCDHNGGNIIFNDTFMLQSSKHIFTFYNESYIKLNVNWSLEDRSQTGNYFKNPPFIIEPTECVVEAMKMKQFTIQFSPSECASFTYLLKGIVSLYNNEENQNCEITLNGSSIRPICHFEMVESPDYLFHRSNDLRNENGIVGPIETSNIKVVTVDSIGLKNRNSYRLQVINPSNENFDYVFDTVGLPSLFWKCHQKAGVIYGGKRSEITFEYLPESEDICETFFQFRIPKMNINQLFLFVGKVIEPKVTLSASHIDFHSVLINSEGSTVNIILQNEEHIPFNFSFDSSSLSNFNSQPILLLQPNRGTIPPFGRITITATFTPTEERVYNCNVPCIISRKPRRLQLFMKGEGYALLHMVKVLDCNMNQSPKINIIDFGSVQVNDSSSKVITVSNEGLYSFDYSWDVSSLDESLIIFDQENLNGKIGKGAVRDFSISFRPYEEIALKNSRIQLNIGGIYIYNFVLRGIAVKPSIHFSFTTYSFGPCFMKDGFFNPIPETVSLIIKNNELIKDCSVEIFFQENSTFLVQFSQTVLEPGMTMTVPIIFVPRELKDYNCVIFFLINGMTKVSVSVSGTGIKPIIELTDFNQEVINFGSVTVGEIVKKSVGLINRSLKPITIRLVESNNIGKVTYDDRGINFSPSNEFILLPRKKSTVTLSFSPKSRHAKFEDDLYINFLNTTMKLLQFSGKAKGIDVFFDTDVLFFGNVVEGFDMKKNVSLRNIGDISVAFNWIESSLSSDFSVIPINGTLLPSMTALFTITFKPQKENENIQQNLLLNVNGLASPLQVNCIGGCIPRVLSLLGAIELKTSVRKSTSNNTILIKNPSDTDWEIFPVIENGYWTSSCLKVPKKETRELIVVYTPLSMSSNEPHKSSLLIPLPDGNTMSYNLIGHSGSPECSGEINIETSAKKQCSFNLNLTNWLNKIQKFNIDIIILEQSSIATFFRGPSIIALNPLVSKDIHFSFDAYVEGINRARITLTSVKSGEYVYFNITAKATIPEVIDIIHMESRVRSVSKRIIAIMNPLAIDETVQMGTLSNDEWWICDSKFIRLKVLKPFSGNTEALFEIEFRPLVFTQIPSECLLTIFTKHIGIFKYKIITTSFLSLQDKLVLETSFGNCLNKRINFKAFNSSKCEYQCIVKDSKVLNVPNSISVDQCDWNGNDVQLTLTYDPSDIGEMKDSLKLFSPDGSEYIFDIIARCLPPIPQGPYIFKGLGTRIDIPFRNSFSSQSSFKCYSDCSNFCVVNPTFSLQQKSSGTIVIELKPVDVKLSTGKLFVHSTTFPDMMPWIFYLSGVGIRP